ncbi:hypothetical protein ATANTOWER_030820 [Ataeniobius toweri]|uniref:Uncharacterized protein n=1 Tax=Ataeniobius toweri TaxID=208326 RepID=A0ABU7BCF2_9TELE|nr:hypothetical protein [Ataeniobius toweri]
MEVQVPDDREPWAAAQRHPPSGVVSCYSLDGVIPLVLVLSPIPSCPSSPPPPPPPCPPSSTRRCAGRHEHSNHSGSHHT